MRLNSKIFIRILIIFYLFEILEIKAHNTFNVGSKKNFPTIINKRSNERKFKIFKKDKNLIKEQNSCVNNSLCRG